MRTLSGFLLAALLVLTTGVRAQPKLQVVEGTKHDFGTMSRGTKIEKKVTLKNVGTETLVIGKVDAACGCTGTLVSNDHLKPGETGSLAITFNSQNFSGYVHKTVTVNSNSQPNAATVIEFSATVQEEISLTPNHIWFRDAQVGLQTTATLTIKNQGKRALTLKEAKTQLDGFTLKLPDEPIKPGSSVQLVAEFTPKAARQVLSDGVIIMTSSPTQPQVYVQIYGNIKEFKFE